MDEATRTDRDEVWLEISALVGVNGDDPWELHEAVRARLQGPPVGDEQRMAAIGRAVVDFAFPDDPRAARQATPERVRDWLGRRMGELHALETSDALRVGRLVIDTARALGHSLGHDRPKAAP